MEPTKGNVTLRVYANQLRVVLDVVLNVQRV